ncbi:cytochrome b5-like heme/steroid binding domain-containing protein [Xylariales sp. PMI_506]|nr:cytochrome b5-like heme/steroid binding domain-containing protein [Xylariales sp. PMI_506]
MATVQSVSVNGVDIVATTLDSPVHDVKSALVIDNHQIALSRITSPSELPTEEFIESAAPKTFTLRQVSSHKTSDDLWIVIDNEVYDVTKFQKDHPGGSKVIAGVAGKDATKKFDKYHRRGLLQKYKKDLVIGVIGLEQPREAQKTGLFGKFGLKKK